MQSFIGSIPVSTRFAPEIPRSLVPVGVGHALGRASDIGQRFVEVLTAEYRGRSLMTDVECGDRFVCGGYRRYWIELVGRVGVC
jgi:hypothetical protein